MQTITVRNKNVLFELLNSGFKFENVKILAGLKQDPLTTKIIETARRHGITVQSVPIHQMPRSRSGNHHEAITANLPIENDETLDSLLTKLYQKNETPFFLLLNRVTYSSNLGVIIRTAFASGVNGVFYQGDKSQLVNDEIFHSSMGTIARVPLIKMTIFDALNNLKNEGIKTYSIQMNGSPYFNENLIGPAAFVLGEEGEGLSDNVSNRCDKKLAIPMRPGIDSLNVSASASIILYEKVRQESTK